MLTNNQNQIAVNQAQTQLLELFSKDNVFNTLKALVIVKMVKNPAENLNYYDEDTYNLILLRGIEIAKAHFKE